MQKPIQYFLYFLYALLFLFAVIGKAGAADLKPGAWYVYDKAYGLHDFYLYIPEQAKPALGNKRALMVVLHGCKQTAADDVIDNREGWEPVAEQYGMVLAAPTVPLELTSKTRYVPGCWDWFGTDHERGTRDTGKLADMINGLLSMPELNLDTKQVYMVGASSGAGVAQVFSCLYPEMLAGVGFHSGAELGTDVGDIFGEPKVSATDSANLCRKYAGERKASLDTQIASVIHGSVDRIVDARHAERNRDALQELYGAKKEAGKIAEANKSDGAYYQDSNGKVRIGYIMVEGLGHAYSAGNGGRGGGAMYGEMFHNYKHVNYSAWVTKFFFDNNLRVKR